MREATCPGSFHVSFMVASKEEGPQVETAAAKNTYAHLQRSIFLIFSLHSNGSMQMSAGANTCAKRLKEAGGSV